MQPRPLRFVADPPAPPERRPWRVAILALGVLAAAAAATLLGADAGRRTSEAAGLAWDAVEPVVEGGDPDAPPLRALRRRLVRRPLDAVARGLYAAALEAVARAPDDREAAVFHARAAAALAPTTLPVVRGACLILARCGREDTALSLARRAFDHDPARAARLLSDLEPYLSSRTAEGGLPESPEAWVAWGARLLAIGRTADAERQLSETVSRWPRHLPARELRADLALGRGGGEALARWVPADLPLPSEPAAARLILYRARVRAHDGDAAGARADVETALRLRGEEPGILSLAAAALETVGDLEAARDHYLRALYRLGAGTAARGLRADLLVRLARLEDRRGSAAAALRAWREVVREFPELEGARRRLEELEGSAP